MSFPLTLLNSSNRKLHDEIERLRHDVTEKKYQCSKYQDVVGLLKTNSKNVHREIDDLQKEVTEISSQLEKRKSEILQLNTQEDGYRRLEGRLSTELNTLQSSVAHIEKLIVQRRQGLQSLLQESFRLEEAVQGIIVLQEEMEGKENAVSNTVISRSVWTRLQMANEELRRWESTVTAASEEQVQVLRDLERIQESLSASVKDQKETVAMLEAVQNKSEALDSAIRRTASMMKELVSEEEVRKNEKEQLSINLQKLEQEKQEVERKNDEARIKFNHVVSTMRAVLVELMQQTELLTSSRQRKKSIKKEIRNLKLHLANTSIQFEERLESIRGCEQYKLYLQEFLHHVQHHHDVLSTRPLEIVLDSLKKRLQQLDAYNHRVQDKINGAVHFFSVEGCEADKLNNRIIAAQQELALLEQEMEKTKTTLVSTKEIKEKCNSITEDVARKLQKLERAAMEESVLCESVLRHKIVFLQEKLAHELSRFRELRTGITRSRMLLRNAVQATLKLRDSTALSQEVHRSLELQNIKLESEMRNVQSKAEVQESHFKSACAAQEVLSHSAQHLIEHVAEAYEATEILRGTIAVQEAQLEAQQQHLLVTLHLEEKSFSAIKEKRRELSKHLDTVIARYKDSMEFLSRRTTGDDKVNDQLTFSDGIDETVTPESLHARYLLQRSCEREDLLKRGNFLDQRVVMLSKKVKTLKKMMTTIQVSKSASPLQELMFYPEPSLVEQESDLEIQTKQRSLLLQDEVRLRSESVQLLVDRQRSVKQQLKDMKRALTDLKTVLRKKKLELSKLREAARKQLSKNIILMHR